MNVDFFTIILTAHVGRVAASSENDVDDVNRRVVLVGTKLQLPCTPPDAEGEIIYIHIVNQNNNVNSYINGAVSKKKG